MVVEEGRGSPEGPDELLSVLIELIGGHSGLNLPSQLREHLVQKRTSLTHLGDLSGIFDRNHYFAPRASRIAA